MLTDTALKNLKPKDAPYKVTDRDGMYVTVSTAGTVTFRYDYRINSRRETLTIGRYGPGGLSLARAREKCIDAKRAVSEGQSPAQEKQREKRRLSDAKTFQEFTDEWYEGARMADSTRSMRKSILDRDILPVFKSRLLSEISPDDLRDLCDKVKGRGAPATAIHVRDIIKQIYGFAILHGEKVANPADDVGPSSIATFVARDRALSPSEIRIMLKQLEYVASYPTIKLGLRLILLTLVRKGELIHATWDEIDFEKALWTIPKARMKAGKAHNIYLSQQALDIMIALRTCAGGSRYLLPSRYDGDKCMSNATLNRVGQIVVERSKAKGLPIENFTVHDLRRTGSTILNELGFNSDWIEKCLAHEDGRSSRGIYNKAEYAEQRRHMLQEWADMVDAWVAGESHTPTLLPPSMKIITTQALL
ncbi:MULTISPECIES: tyrosine-type recombinase/integrase [Oxalobacteraceae]|jgi:integrase|uniref:tyrosine-type recombinase/integrase n=1 Tax=Oxalobacteraceae TaxID=75682 RepID=UPI002AB51ED3|nr:MULTISPECIES: integrase arm-type DNA-binding domain-containing protein [Oxalobacteraceae]MDY7578715.1 tyrosine-type recombinase/integrase [Herbaspirillum sp. RTI4]MEA9980587.1 tyrosine-type recombinase/integrase [Herbaspirillum sp. RTI4]MEB0139469.1 tyrosine-type recombinase/integrase [Undibacterium sp. CCC2.1]MEB0171649.1 tyrosine-type recombinase/integrase [Undibacterium sp. CCC1.1]MEB0176213.1 tyrosine-type recombinase/integrase [Undibacterium sp. CCC3.4]